MYLSDVRRREIVNKVLDAIGMKASRDTEKRKIFWEIGKKFSGSRAEAGLEYRNHGQHRCFPV
jgi:hypothetical protein